MAYVGFNKLQGQLAQKPGVTDPAALAASIGRKKYGKKAMGKAASSGHSLKGQDKRGQMIAAFMKQGHGK